MRAYIEALFITLLILAAYQVGKLAGKIGYILATFDYTTEELRES